MPGSDSFMFASLAEELGTGVRFQTLEEVKVISLQKLAASCGVWRQPATLQLFSKPSGHQARRVEGPGKMKAPGLTEAFKGGQRVHLGVDVA